MRASRLLAAALGLVAASPSLAAEAGFNGGSLSPLWIVPFAGILLSIAVVPVTAPSFWHHHFGKTSAFWALAFLVPFAVYYGVDLALREVVHTLVAEYVPFIILLLALFTVSGGIHIRGNLHGSARLNTGILALGTRAGERHGHYGGGDASYPAAPARKRQPPPPRACRDVLHLPGSEHWRRLDAAWRSAAVPRIPQGGRLLLDHEGDALATRSLRARCCWRCSTSSTAGSGAARTRCAALDRDPTPDHPIRIEGKINFLFLLAIVIMVLLSGVWKSGVSS